MPATSWVRVLSNAGLLLALSAAGCKKPAAVEQAPVQRVRVDTVVVTEDMVPRVLAFTGTLRGQHQTDLAANAAGRVLETFVERGSEVKKDDIIAKLDVRAATAAAAEAHAHVAVTGAQADAAKRDCARYEALLAQQAISQAEYDRAADQCKTLPLSKRAAEARARAAAQTVSDGTVRAPFAGVVAERAVEIGQYVRPDSRVVTLVDVDPLRLEIPVPEAVAPKVVPGAKVTFTVAGHPGRTFEGQVKFISPAVREATRDVMAEAEVPNEERALLPGMFADVRIESGASKQPVIPKTALVQRHGRDAVFAVVEGRLEERVVQLGLVKGATVACLRGLRAGERVVNRPAETLHNGQAVE
jgi:membrane fusion protein, multidrug efflux system